VSQSEDDFGNRLKGDAIVAPKSAAITLVSSLFVLLGASSCAPPGGSFANPQVTGDHSTISGDSAATRDAQIR
jgi:hypothetical protein